MEKYKIEKDSVPEFLYGSWLRPSAAGKAGRRTDVAS